MNRKDFIKTTVVASSGLFAFKGLSPSAWAAPSPSQGMPHSPLGRTGALVSKIGIGCNPFGRDNTDQSKVTRIVDKALDMGINYMDTAPNYFAGESERRLGRALRGKRDKAFIATKTEEYSYEGTWRLLRESLQHMQTDYIDLVHLHNLGHPKRWPDLDFAFSERGAMGALREARERGVVRFIGATGHIHPSRFHYAIDSGEIDVLMNAVNFVNQHTYDFENKIWSRALQENIGLVSMKVFGGANGNGFRLPMEDYENALRYTLSLNGLNTAVIGINTMEQLDQLLETFPRVDALSEDEFLALAQHGLDLIKTDAKWKAAHGLPIT